jgi:putative aldouronate transport system permease protein
VLPGTLYLILFKIAPIWGLSLALIDFNPMLGVLGSKWVGVKNFADLFATQMFFRMLRNTLAINILSIILFFPVPIVLAIMLSEVRNQWFQRVCQSIVYLPHFLSWVVIASFTFFFLSTDVGIINKLLGAMGHDTISFLQNPKLFWVTLVLQNIWKDTGWGTIIFLAAISGINPELYESAAVDGAGRWKQITQITIPSISYAIIVLFILRLGTIINVNFEQVLLMINPLVLEVGQVFDTYVYTHGVLAGELSVGVTVGIFKSIIGLLMVVSSNYVIKRMGHEGIY